MQTKSSDRLIPVIMYKVEDISAEHAKFIKKDVQN